MLANSCVLPSRRRGLLEEHFPEKNQTYSNRNEWLAGPHAVIAKQDQDHTGLQRTESLHHKGCMPYVPQCMTHTCVRPTCLMYRFNRRRAKYGDMAAQEHSQESSHPSQQRPQKRAFIALISVTEKR